MDVFAHPLPALVVCLPLLENFWKRPDFFETGVAGSRGNPSVYLLGIYERPCGCESRDQSAQQRVLVPPTFLLLMQLGEVREDVLMHLLGVFSVRGVEQLRTHLKPPMTPP